MSPAKSQKMAATARRYGGTTFVIVGKTHDPSIMESVLKPRKSRDSANPGYIGYLWRGKNPEGKAPHELLPIDFTPAQLHYPEDWKNMFATKGFLVGMHVPASFAGRKNALSRALYRAGRTVDPKKEWSFIKSLQQYGYASAQDALGGYSLVSGVTR